MSRHKYTTQSFGNCPSTIISEASTITEVSYEDKQTQLPKISIIQNLSYEIDESDDDMEGKATIASTQPD